MRLPRRRSPDAVRIDRLVSFVLDLDLEISSNIIILQLETISPAEIQRNFMNESPNICEPVKLAVTYSGTQHSPSGQDAILVTVAFDLLYTLETSSATSCPNAFSLDNTLSANVPE